jgi:hypothetical protein
MARSRLRVRQLASYVLTSLAISVVLSRTLLVEEVRPDLEQPDAPSSTAQTSRGTRTNASDTRTSTKRSSRSKATTAYEPSESEVRNRRR